MLLIQGTGSREVPTAGRKFAKKQSERRPKKHLSEGEEHTQKFSELLLKKTESAAR